MRWGAEVTLISNSRNLGFAGGMNVGIRHALEERADWILVLNNDTVAAPDMMSTLLRQAAAHPSVGILSPAIYYFDEPSKVWRLGDRQYSWIPVPRKLPDHLVDREEFLPVDYVTGCAMLVRRQVFETIGLFDDQLFMYYEDADFCRRATDAGYAVACVTKARLWHKVSQSAKKTHVASRYQQVKNRIAFFRRYPHGPSRALTDLYLFMDALRSVGIDLLSGHRTLATAAWRGLIDGWRASSLSPDGRP